MSEFAFQVSGGQMMPIIWQSLPKAVTLAACNFM